LTCSKTCSIGAEKRFGRFSKQRANCGLIRNQQVAGSIPAGGSSLKINHLQDGAPTGFSMSVTQRFLV
jgi:hypothetical protein